MSDFDPVKKPEHYNSHPSGVETYEITRHHCFTIGNVLKYVMRHEHKGCPLQDLEKAAWYLNKKIEHYKELESDG